MNRLVLAALVVSTGFAGCYAAVTGLAPHRAWALAAVFGYGLALLVWLCRRWLRRGFEPLMAAVLLLGTLLVPLAWELCAGLANPEVGILREAAARWLVSGTPFPEAGSADPNAYNVYLPGLSLFGLPSALFGSGPLTDPRLYLLLGSVLLFAALGRHWPNLALLCCPFAALQLVTGATDIPVLGCVLLGFSLAGRGRFGAAGLLLGFAAAMKAFAWPAVVVLLILACARGGARAAPRAGLPCLGLAAVLLVPVILADPHAFWANAIQLPLGGLDVRLTAGSPLPGHLLAAAVPGGALLAGVLLVLAAVVLGIAMLRRPPKDAKQAARWLALGLTAAILLAPSSRFGYLVYPLGLLLLPYLEAHGGSRARLGDAGQPA